MLHILTTRYDSPSVRLASRDSSMTRSRASSGATQCSKFVSQIVPTDIQVSRRDVSPPPPKSKGIARHLGGATKVLIAEKAADNGGPVSLKSQPHGVPGAL